MSKRAMRSAQLSGNRRERMKESILDEKNRREKQVYDRSKMGKAEYFTDPDGVQTAMQQNDRGQYVPVEELEGMKPFKQFGRRGGAGGGKVWYSAVVNGVKGLQNSDTGEFKAAGAGISDEALADFADAENENLAAREKQKAIGKGEGTWVDKAVDSGYESASNSRSMMTPLQDMVNAIDDGANVGQLWNRLPTFTDATSQFDSAASTLTLENLKKYKLTPVSDRDLAELRRSAVPTYSNEQAKAWAQHKMEGLKLMSAADEYVADWVNENQKRPNAAERKQIEEHITNSIIAGHDFAFKSGGKAKEFAPEGAGAGPSQTDLDFTAEKHGITVEEVKRRLGQ